MKYYSEVDENNQLIKEKVCTDISKWIPSRDGLRLVIDEQPEYNPNYQLLGTRLDRKVFGDEVSYFVLNLSKELTESSPTEDKNAADTFLRNKGIITSNVYYDCTGYSVNMAEDIYNIFVFDRKWYLKVHAGTVIEWCEVTDFLDETGVLRDLDTGHVIEKLKYVSTTDTITSNYGESLIRYDNDFSKLLKYPTSDYKKGNPPSRGSLSNDYRIILWSVKPSGDIEIEYKKYKD